MIDQLKDGSAYLVRGGCRWWRRQGFLLRRDVRNLPRLVRAHLLHEEENLSLTCTDTYKDLCARSRYQGQGHVITSHRYRLPFIAICNLHTLNEWCHDDVIKWKHFPRYWPFVRGIHRSPVNSPHKGQWRGALMFSLIFVWINGWVNNGEAGDLRRYRAHYDVIVMP